MFNSDSTFVELTLLLAAKYERPSNGRTLFVLRRLRLNDIERSSNVVERLSSFEKRNYDRTA